MRITGLALTGLLTVSAAVAAPRPQTPRLFDITVARQVVDGRPMDAATVLPPDTGEIVVWFRHEGLAPGARVSAVWRFLGGAAPLLIGESSVTIAGGANWADFSLEPAPGKPWFEGPYRVEFLVAERSIGEARFSIARPSARLGAAESAPAVSAVPAAPTAPAPAAPAGAATSANRRYVHPRVGFSLAPPEAWTMDDSGARADLQMKASGGAGLVEITSGPTSARLDPISYAAGWESMAVGPGRLLLAKRQGHPSSVDREGAYEAVYQQSFKLPTR